MTTLTAQSTRAVPSKILKKMHRIIVRSMSILLQFRTYEDLSSPAVISRKMMTFLKPNGI